MSVFPRRSSTSNRKAWLRFKNKVSVAMNSQDPESYRTLGLPEWSPEQYFYWERVVRDWRTALLLWLGSEDYEPSHTLWTLARVEHCKTINDNYAQHEFLVCTLHNAATEVDVYFRVERNTIDDRKSLTDREAELKEKLPNASRVMLASSATSGPKVKEKWVNGPALPPNDLAPPANDTVTIVKSRSLLLGGKAANTIVLATLDFPEGCKPIYHQDLLVVCLAAGVVSRELYDLRYMC